MHMLYDSDSYAVVLFDDLPAAKGGTQAHPQLRQGGYELVDKFARKEIFLQGVMAESFKDDVEALLETQPTQEDMDDLIERFASLMQQPVVLH